jgi:hypothetical protein
MYEMPRTDAGGSRMRGRFSAAHREYLTVRCVPISASHDALISVSFGAFCDFLDSGAECDCNEVFIPKAKQTMKPI